MDAMQLLGSLLGNNATSSGVGGQLLNQLLGGLGGGGDNARPSGMGGGGQQLLGQLVNSLSGGGSRPVGGAGGVDLAGLLGLAMTALQSFSQRSATAGSAAPLAALAGSLGFGQPGASVAAAPLPPQADQQALVLVRAMINAAKADGQIDVDEQQKITAKLSEVGQEELEFVQAELAKPLNFDFFADITTHIAPQVYAVSLMAINLDTPAESSYLQQLAQGLGLDAKTVNAIHAQLGLPPLFG